MASLRRSKVLSPDSQTAKFLYTIIKQLDLKAIDWSEVASGLEITNGHAARMRYSRFKAQIEGLPTQSKPRAARPKKDAPAAAKGKGKNKPGYEPGKVDDLNGGGDDDDCDGDLKMEQERVTVIKEERVPNIKQEHSVADVRIEPMAANDTVKIKPEPGLMTPSSTVEEPTAPTVNIKQEPTTSPSTSPFPLSPTSGLAALDLTPYQTPPPTPSPAFRNLKFSPAPTHTYSYNHYAHPTTLPPQATVSLADLQLPPIPRSTHQMPLPTFSYPLSPMPMPMPMDFDFGFNAPIMMPTHLQNQPPWLPHLDMFRPVNGGGGGVKRERED